MKFSIASFFSFLLAQVRPGVHHLGEVEHARNGPKSVSWHLQPSEGFPAEGVQQPLRSQRWAQGFRFFINYFTSQKLYSCCIWIVCLGLENRLANDIIAMSNRYNMVLVNYFLYLKSCVNPEFLARVLRNFIILINLLKIYKPVSKRSVLIVSQSWIGLGNRLSNDRIRLLTLVKTLLVFYYLTKENLSGMKNRYARSPIVWLVLGQRNLRKTCLYHFSGLHSLPCDGPQNNLVSSFHHHGGIQDIVFLWNHQRLLGQRDHPRAGLHLVCEAPEGGRQWGSSQRRIGY